jgi:hypothetical protein
VERPTPVLHKIMEELYLRVATTLAFAHARSFLLLCWQRIAFSSFSFSAYTAVSLGPCEALPTQADYFRAVISVSSALEKNRIRSTSEFVFTFLFVAHEQERRRPDLSTAPPTAHHVTAKQPLLLVLSCVVRSFAKWVATGQLL